MSQLRNIWWPIVLCVALLNCKSSQGEPCKEPNDCASRLLCCPIDKRPQDRGTCLETCKPNVVAVDAGPEAPDAGPDVLTDGGGDTDVAL